MSKIEKAIALATKAHDGMMRKCFPQPYIFHPLEVLSLAYLLTDEEDILCACVLHDVAEDTSISIDYIREEFGERVAQIVNSETENKRKDRPKSETWVIRKQETINKINNSSDVANKIVCLCDKVSNLRSFHLMKFELNEKLWYRFNMKDPKMHYWYYNSLKEGLEELKDTVVYKEYEYLMDDVFEEYVK